MDSDPLSTMETGDRCRSQDSLAREGDVTVIVK